MIGDRVGHFRKMIDDARLKVDEEDRPAIVKEAARRDPRIVNLLDMVIDRRKGLKRKGDYLLIPVYETEKGEKIASALHLKTRRKVRLDEHGWLVWESMDGKRDVRELGQLLRERFGDEVEPLYPRLSKFLSYLNSLDLIRIRKKKQK